MMSRDSVMIVHSIRQVYGTHTLRRTKAALIYRRTKNLRAVQLLLGHSKLESTVRYLGIEVDDAFEMARADEGVDADAGGRLITQSLTGQKRAYGPG
jgi:integrase